MRNVPIELMLAGAGVGPRHMACRFDTFATTTPAMAQVLAAAQAYADQWPQPVSGKSMVFTGPPGTGKTHLCTAVVASLLQRRTSGLYAPMARVVRRVRDTWVKSSKKNESEAIAELLSPALLVIDEFLPATAFERELIAEVLNERYAQRKPFIVATNIPASELHQHLPARTIDRMREDGGAVLAFDWPSARGAKIGANT